MPILCAADDVAALPLPRRRGDSALTLSQILEFSKILKFEGGTWGDPPPHDVAPGSVWRLKSEAGNTTDIKLIDEPWFIVDRSVWQSIEPLSYFI